MKRNIKFLIIQLVIAILCLTMLFAEGVEPAAPIDKTTMVNGIELEEKGPYLIVKQFGKDRIYVTFPLEPELQWSPERAVYSSTFEELGEMGIHSLIVTAKSPSLPSSEMFEKIRQELQQKKTKILSWQEKKKLGKDVMDLQYIDQKGRFVRARIFLGKEKVCTLSTIFSRDIKPVHEEFIHGFSFVNEMKF